MRRSPLPATTRRAIAEAKPKHAADPTARTTGAAFGGSNRLMATHASSTPRQMPMAMTSSAGGTAGGGTWWGASVRTASRPATTAAAAIHSARSTRRSSNHAPSGSAMTSADTPKGCTRVSGPNFSATTCRLAPASVDVTAIHHRGRRSRLKISASPCMSWRDASRCCSTAAMA